MAIINEFKTEKDLFSYYPKTKYFTLQNVFNDYWDSFLDFAKSRNLVICDVVHRDVNRMIDCKTPSLGGSAFKCPEYGNIKYRFNTCKSRFYRRHS